MRISEEKINEIAQANDIVEVISSYTRVKNSGKSYLAICPFHQDKNPSMSISQEKRVYHCFSCGASGNLFKFVQNIEKITFMDAVEKLAQRAGIALDLQSYSPDLTNEITLLLEINKIAARYFHDTLFDLSGAEKDFIFSYLRKRNLKDYTIKKFGLGYAKKDWNSLHDYFRENTEFSDDNLEKAGLIVKSTKDNKYYDRFRGRLMFPIFNESGKVVAFGGRKLFEDDNTAKYINSPESKIYNKSKILYGLNFAKDSIRSEKRVLLVEGYMDLIALVQAKFTNCVSSSGTSLTDDQVKILSRYTSNVSILFDGDFAGIKAAKRGIEKILQGGAELRITVFPENEDPDSYIANKGINEFGQLINSGSDFIEFISNLLAKENKLKSVADKTNFIREIIYFISFIPDKIKRSFYIKKLASEYGLYESLLQDELNIALKKNTAVKSSTEIRKEQPFNNLKKNKQSVISRIETELIEHFIHGDNEVIEYLENNLETSFIRSEHALKIIQLFLDEYLNDGKIDVAKIMNSIKDEKLIEIIAAASTEKYKVNDAGIKDRNAILNSVASIKMNYLESVKGLIKTLRIEKLEREYKEKAKDSSKLDECVKLKKEIFQLSKN